ncbi:unnamed protein product [Rhizoctonia solani]|uniref:Uncharacterized protein n=1 Tax=Rhizoctonia solani TaxID=456999 RepID=A0A8H3GEK7_9AGAM|nr:unnamed protein product [Rhizoctonia solani]
MYNSQRQWVVGVETRPPPTDLLFLLPSHLAPDLIINPRGGVENALASISSSFDGAPGVAATIVSTDPVEAFSFATRIMAKQAAVAVIGRPEDPIPFSCNDIIFKDMTIVARMPSLKPRLEEMVELVVSVARMPSLKPRLEEMVELVVSVGIKVEVRSYPFDKLEELI